jgi:hypothetical protein
MKNLKLILYLIVLSLLTLNCTDEYKYQGLKHPSQLHNIIIVDKRKYNNWYVNLVYFDLKDSTFKKCNINICYEGLYSIKDTIK